MRKAADPSRPEIEAAAWLHPDLDARADHLGVSTQALKRRMSRLGLR